jgi:hypothetical protein
VKALETVREEWERLREAGETARAGDEEARAATEAAVTRRWMRCTQPPKRYKRHSNT